MKTNEKKSTNRNYEKLATKSVEYKVTLKKKTTTQMLRQTSKRVHTKANTNKKKSTKNTQTNRKNSMIQTPRQTRR